MTHHKLTIITILFLAISFIGLAQYKEVKQELNPKAPKAEPVKIEQINNQDILRVASLADTIRILLSNDTWTQIENLMQSSVGSELTLKDIEGADVHLVRVTKNTKPGIYFRNKMIKSISVSDEQLVSVKQ